MSKPEKSQMHVFLIARGGVGKTKLKLNRKFDDDLVAMVVGWLMQEQYQRDEGKPPITELKAKLI